jgi:hypothetical protein
MQTDFSELLQLLENYQPMKDWVFTLSAKHEGDPESWLVYTSQWCKIKIYHRKDFHQSMREDSLHIYYGRIHALDDSPTMEHEGQMYFCWFSPDNLVYSFLDGKSPEEAFKSRFDTPQFLSDLFARAKESENKVPRLPGEEYLEFQKAIWDQYGLRFFELLDIRRPDLWDSYISFLKEYAKLKSAKEEEKREENAKRLEKIYSEQKINIYRTSSNVTKTLEIPLYNRI